MTLIIMRRLRSSSPSMSVYFTGLAVFDLLLIYTLVLRNWIKIHFHWDCFAKGRAICKLGVFLVYVTGVSFSWILVVMTAQRAASVVWPHRVNVVCTDKDTFHRHGNFSVQCVDPFTLTVWI